MADRLPSWIGSWNKLTCTCMMWYPVSMSSFKKILSWHICIIAQVMNILKQNGRLAAIFDWITKQNNIHMFYVVPCPCVKHQNPLPCAFSIAINNRPFIWAPNVFWETKGQVWQICQGILWLAYDIGIG